VTKIDVLDNHPLLTRWLLRVWFLGGSPAASTKRAHHETHDEQHRRDWSEPHERITPEECGMAPSCKQRPQVIRFIDRGISTTHDEEAYPSVPVAPDRTSPAVSGPRLGDVEIDPGNGVGVRLHLVDLICS
jgi:hypothetical protein